MFTQRLCFSHVKIIWKAILLNQGTIKYLYCVFTNIHDKNRKLYFSSNMCFYLSVHVLIRKLTRRLYVCLFEDKFRNVQAIMIRGRYNKYNLNISIWGTPKVGGMVKDTELCPRWVKKGITTWKWSYIKNIFISSIHFEMYLSQYLRVL